MFTPVDAPWHCGYTAYISVRRLLLITDINEPNMLEVKIKKNNALFQSLNNYVDRRPTSCMNFRSFSQLM